MIDRLLTPREVSERLGLRLATVYRWGWARRIPSVKVFGALRFRSSDIEALVRAGFRPADQGANTKGTRR